MQSSIHSYCNDLTQNNPDHTLLQLIPDDDIALLTFQSKDAGTACPSMDTRYTLLTFLYEEL